MLKRGPNLRKIRKRRKRRKRTKRIKRTKKIKRTNNEFIKLSIIEFNQILLYWSFCILRGFIDAVGYLTT